MTMYIINNFKCCNRVRIPKWCYHLSFLFTLFICIALSAQPVKLHFFDSVLVNEAKVLLQDIAEIHGQLDESKYSVLRETVVGDAAPAGYSRYMNAYDVIQFVLSPQYKNIAIQASGAKRVKISTDARKRSVGDFEEQILDYLHESISWKTDEYTVSIKNKDREWKCYRKPCRIALKGLMSPYPKGNIRIKLEISQDETKFTIPVMCKVRVQVPVVCAAETIARNEIINESNLEYVKMDISGFRHTPFCDINAVTGKKAVRILTPGAILHKGCIKAIPDVYKGDNVFILINKGPIKVSVPARAREEGVKGDRIWVENLKTHKLIRVKVAGKGIVHLNKGEAI